MAGRFAQLGALVRWSEWYDSKLPLFLVAMSYAVLREDSPGAAQLFQMALLFGLLCLYAACGHLVNDYSDRDVDRAAGKRRLLARWSRRSALGLIAGAAAATLLLALPFGGSATVLVAFSLGLAAAYSLPPARLKERGAVGWLAAALAQRTLPLAIVFQALGAWDAGAAALCVAGTAIGFRFIILHQIHDRPHDLKAGVRTGATTHDPGELAWYVRNVVFPIEIASVSAAVLAMAILLPSIAVAGAAFGYGGWRLARSRGKQASPLSFLFFRDFYCILWPVLLASLLALRNPLFVGVPVLAVALQNRRLAASLRRFRPARPPARAVDEAISAGVAALVRIQQADGSFPLQRCAPPEPWAPCGPLFGTACIVLGAGQLLPAESLTRALDFIRSLRRTDGLWNFDPALGIPPDADSTACCLAALAIHGEAPDTDGPKLLRSFWRPDGGPFSTWRAEGVWAERDRDDPVVNCNVVLALRCLGSPATPAERDAVLDLLCRSMERARYYAVPAAIAHAAGRAGLPLDALPPAAAARPASEDLAGVVQWLCGTRERDAELIERVLAAQEPDGTWPVCSWLTGAGKPRPYWGSAAVSTALALEALGAVRDPTFD